MFWYCMAWFGLVWYAMALYGMVLENPWDMPNDFYFQKLKTQYPEVWDTLEGGKHGDNRGTSSTVAWGFRVQ